MFRAVLVFTLAAALAAAGAQPVAGQQPLASTPLFKAGVHLDLVDVVVRDRKTGALVRGLTQGDFEVDDNGRPQPIASFASVDLPAAGAGGAVAPRGGDGVATNEGPQGRVIAFFVDDWTLRFGTTGYVRDLLHLFVDRHMTPDDQVAIWTVSGALPRQGFTTDRARLDSVIDRMTGTGGAISMGPVPFYPALDQLPSWGEMGVLIRSLAPFSNERKIVVYLGSWFAGIPLDDEPAYEQLLAEAAAANVAIYPVSVRGVTGHVSLPLNILADETGGIVAHRNDFDRVMARIEEDAGSYYLLGFSPDVHDPRADRVHSLRVRVRRPGLVVQARSKYVPFPSFDPFQVSRAARQVAQVATAPLLDRDLPLRITASSFRDRKRADRVVVTIHADRPGRQFAGHTVEYAIDAIDDHMRIVDTATGASKVPAASTAAGLTIVSAVQAKTGLSTIRAAVRSDDGTAGSVSIDVDIPRLDAPLSLSDLALSSGAAHTLVVGTPPAFLTRHLPTPPVVDRTFAADDIVTVYGEVYSSRATAHPSATLVVRGAGGAVERRIGLTLAESTGAPRRFRYVSPVPLNGLAAGPHVLEVTAADGTGRTQTRRVALAIEGGASATSNR